MILQPLLRMTLNFLKPLNLVTFAKNFKPVFHSYENHKNLYL